MIEQINISQLGKLLNNLHLITGLKFALMDYGANEIYTSSYKNEFCALIADTPEGYQRCVACDNAQLSDLQPGGTLKKYRCHAGLIEAAIPVTESGRIVATVLLGQLLSDEGVERQWENTRRLCSWYHDMAALERAFRKLRCMSEDEINACAEIALACVSEVRFKGLLSASSLTDFQRLTLYIDQHYMESLTLDRLARALNIGKTKLCGLAARETGKTLSRIIAEKRISMAQGMLALTNESVSRIAESVGIPDYNYFAKVFKKLTGETPLNYRKRHRHRSKTVQREA